MDRTCTAEELQAARAKLARVHAKADEALADGDKEFYRFWRDKAINLEAHIRAFTVIH